LTVIFGAVYIGFRLKGGYRVVEITSGSETQTSGIQTPSPKPEFSKI
jgi:hypothetical protein